MVRFPLHQPQAHFRNARAAWCRAGARDRNSPAVPEFGSKARWLWLLLLCCLLWPSWLTRPVPSCLLTTLKVIIWSRGAPKVNSNLTLKSAKTEGWVKPIWNVQCNRFLHREARGQVKQPLYPSSLEIEELGRRKAVACLFFSVRAQNQCDESSLEISIAYSKYLLKVQTQQFRLKCNQKKKSIWLESEKKKVGGGCVWDFCLH